MNSLPAKLLPKYWHLIFGFLLSSNGFEGPNSGAEAGLGLSPSGEVEKVVMSVSISILGLNRGVHYY